MTDRWYRYFELSCGWIALALFAAFVIALAPRVNEWDDLLALPLLALQGPRHLRERAERRAKER